MSLRFAPPVAAIALLAGCASPAPDAPPPVAPPPIAETPPERPFYRYEKTRILSEVDARRLLENKGVTLQWIDWDTRGTAIVTSRDGVWHLRAAQSDASGPGRLFVEGRIVEIGEGYFTLDGTIRISETPDRGRACEADKTWHFAVTQNRGYYRLREFEWCDRSTDYIDIYF